MYDWHNKFSAKFIFKCRHLPLFLSIMGGGDLSHGRVLAFSWSGQAKK